MHFLYRRINDLNHYLPETNRWFVLLASIPVAISAGTIFVYSIYGTQLSDRCHLEASQSANLNISTTFGSAVGAIFGGYITDLYGTQIPMLISCICLTIGYQLLYWQYQLGETSNVWSLIFAMFLVGVGSVSGYFSAIKAVTVNFPTRKATAQSITIASFAISSLVFSIIDTKIYKGDAGAFLKFLTWFSGLMISIGFVFIRVEGLIDLPEKTTQGGEPNESTSLLADSVSLESASEISEKGTLRTQGVKETFIHPIFWYHYFMFAILQGLGQMYIFSVGFILKALHYSFQNRSEEVPSLVHLQAMHVSVIAIASFLGRLSSGPISDYLINRLNSQRHWVLIVGLTLMLIGHLLNTVNITSWQFHSVHLYMVVVSGIIGYSYGFSFASYPAIISDIFNLKHYSLIWGATYSATTFGLSLITKIFGYVYDSNSNIWDGEEYICGKGEGCYKLTFQITSGMCIFVIVLVVLYINRAYNIKQHR
ncbi:uncharacterized protein J8A68_002485 [[Candida] subhashii]|uniref:Major facilitator superfamily (MFS) profile domain-containing protein n=1 Tax=[Candida] subhashii TaxID=561895 RepID=A0A8J5QLU2_9ASCO|nr:uncharacterized protein J8A68_002485 [[Candida] subhashii]KAG7663984.1 hypothetical protein J8A68_002485 [[Candida] subhashii]